MRPMSVFWGIDYLRHRTVYSLCHASIILELFYILVLITVTTMVVLVTGGWLISTATISSCAKISSPPLTDIYNI